MDNRAGMTKVFFRTEQATPLGGDRYRIENILFFAREVSNRDIVRADPHDGTLWFTHVVEAGGHGTIRVIVFNDDSALESSVIAHLLSLGCRVEKSHIPRYFPVAP